MIARVLSAAVIGLDAEIIEVETAVSNGLPATVVVGLPDTAVQESRERVKSAIKHSDFQYPQTRVSVNLAPADVPKIGTHFDLPIALAILLAAEQMNFVSKGKLFVGELSLDGTLRSVPGILPVALQAKAKGIKELYVPAGNSLEAALVSGLQIFAIKDLKELAAHLLGAKFLIPVRPANFAKLFKNNLPVQDIADIAGQESAKRALEIACSGGHNLLLSGPPGSGKTLLAKACAGILPDLSLAEALELTKIYSVSGKLPAKLLTSRPVRSPHHTTSNVALVGGGSNPQPGEITLAHRGVLFLDEFAEFPRHVLEALRQPLEDGVVTVSRAKNTFTFPAKFILVAAQNPCPCGYFGDSVRKCICTPGQIFKYQRKISGPLLDRIDLHVEVPRLSYEKISDTTGNRTSAQTKTSIEQARKIQAKRFAAAKTNSEMSVVEVKRYCVLNGAEREIMKTAMKQYSLSGRSLHRILKVARTIADLAGLENIMVNHLAEAIRYRPKLD